MASTALTLAAGLAVWCALVLPEQLSHLDSGTLLRVPLEGALVVVLGLFAPPRIRRPAAVVLGALVGLMLLLKAADMGMYLVFDRRFDAVNDWVYLQPAIGVVSDSVGRLGTILVVCVAIAFVVLVVAVMAWCTARVVRAIASRRRLSLSAASVLAVICALSAVVALGLGAGTGLASAATTRLAVGEVTDLRAGITDHATFAAAIADDPLRGVSGDRLLAGLRGKDVLVVFVESYGRVAVQNSSFSPGVDAVLDRGTARLRSAGFSARSAFLTSPTFGGLSWLAHSSLESGLWVDNQQRYDQLLNSDRATLAAAFGRAGWRTVFDVPAVTRPWPDGAAFYHFDKLYGAGNVGYHGPRFSYATMPDQYTLAALRRNELAGRHRPPVMAEIDLVSSHGPWTPLPTMVPWRAVGDGSVFDGMQNQGPSPEAVAGHPDEVRALYARSITYTWRTLVSFVRTYPDPNLVLVIMGDHQPNAYVTGPDASHDVPITLVAHDSAVIDRISGWGWSPGLRPAPDAPVWGMDSFRDRFLAAFDRGSGASSGH